MKYKILQLKDIGSVDYAFMPYDYAKKHGFAFDNYRIVYEGTIESEDKIHALEDLFYKFNCNHPADFKGHSLSVSDIIELDGEACYCNPCGWEIGI